MRAADADDASRQRAVADSEAASVVGLESTGITPHVAKHSAAFSRALDRA